uniref:Gamma-aminobutyric acid receptor-associated protein-like 2 n=1 Tax=Mus spicilegus TaxID=10103 RepID=A0A8C6HTG1_MUSSI
MWIIRERIQLPSEEVIFLFVDKTAPQSSLTRGQLYEKEKHEDGFLYVAYSREITFGFRGSCWARGALPACVSCK